jgi:hypothetical protein
MIMDEQAIKDCIRDTLEWKLYKDTIKGEEVWCYPRGNGDYIPINYISEDEIDMLRTDCWDDAESELGELDDIDLFDDLFDEVFYDEMM